MSETKQEFQEGEYESEYRQRLREVSVTRLIGDIYNSTTKAQDRELKELLIDFIIENNLVVE